MLSEDAPKTPPDAPGAVIPPPPVSRRSARALDRYSSHLFVPDTQVKPGVPINHLSALGNYCADKRPDKIIFAGDHWDFPSLSAWDGPVTKAIERYDVQEDIDAGNEAMDAFLSRIFAVSGYQPELHFCIGNHEDRVRRYLLDKPELKTKVSLDHLSLAAFKVHPFLEPVILDGIAYCHFFATDSNGRVMRSKNGQSSARAQVNNFGMSATAGHRQGLDVYLKECKPTRRRGIIAGSFMQHSEFYLTPQGNDFWVGVIHKREVKDGDYDTTEISLGYLLRRYL